MAREMAMMAGLVAYAGSKQFNPAGELSIGRQARTL